MTREDFENEGSVSETKDNKMQDTKQHIDRQPYESMITAIATAIDEYYPKYTGHQRQNLYHKAQAVYEVVKKEQER